MKKRTICWAMILSCILLSGCGDSADRTAESSDTDWFSDYNGEKIHRVASDEGDIYSPARCNDIIFYKADEGETVDSVIAEMKKAILEPLTQDSQDRRYQRWKDITALRVLIW